MPCTGSSALAMLSPATDKMNVSRYFFILFWELIDYLKYYKHEKACHRHSHRVPVAGYIAHRNRLKLNRLHCPPYSAQQGLRSRKNTILAL